MVSELSVVTFKLFLKELGLHNLPYPSLKEDVKKNKQTKNTYSKTNSRKILLSLRQDGSLILYVNFSGVIVTH